MGRAWYQLHGKYLKKKNTFSDFCAVAQHLVDAGWTAPDRLACVGRSAGGLLMGATLNLRPDLFRCCIAVRGGAAAGGHGGRPLPSVRILNCPRARRI